MKKLLDKIFKKKSKDIRDVINDNEDSNNLAEEFPDIPLEHQSDKSSVETQNSMTADSTGENQVYDMSIHTPKWRQFIDDAREKLSLKIHAFKFFINNKKNQAFQMRSMNRDQLALTWKDKIEYYWSKLKLEHWCHWIYQDEARKQINLITIGLIFLISSWGFGESIALLIKGVDQTELNKLANAELKIKTINVSTLDIVRDANLFKTMDTGNQQVIDKPRPMANIRCDKADRKTGLPVKLVNTVVLQDSVKSVASVQVRNSPAEQFREGENLSSLAKIDKIERLRIILKNLESGECEFIESDEANSAPAQISIMNHNKAQDFKKNKPGIENDGNNFKISKKIIDEQLKDLAGLLTQARAIKIVNPDNTLSFKIVEIEPGGIFSTLGIQNEDIIKQIDGKQIESMNQIMGLFSKLKNINKLNLSIERGGSSQELNYSIK
jgi:type II secretory pathway component PulC